MLFKTAETATSAWRPDGRSTEASRSSSSCSIAAAKANQNTANMPRAAIIGTGWGVSVQLPAFRAAGFEITWLWARSAEKAEEIAREHGVPHWTDKSDEVMNADDVDIVIIVSV